MSLVFMTPNKEKEPKSISKANNYAIVETSGSQFRLEANRYYDIDRVNAKIDEKITIDKVLLINDEKGLTIGKPYVESATVELKVMAHRRGTKILVYKMRPKKKTRKKNGHRQELTRVMVTSISNGKKTKKAPTASKPTKQTTTSKIKKEPSSSSKKTTTESTTSKGKKASSPSKSTKKTTS